MKVRDDGRKKFYTLMAEIHRAPPAKWGTEIISRVLNDWFEYTRIYFSEEEKTDGEIRL